MGYGLAKNTTYASAFLHGCGATSQIIVFNEDWMIFKFNPFIEVLLPPQRDVWFDEESAPLAGRIALNRFLIMSNDETIH
jgi:hypothetical protein